MNRTTTNDDLLTVGQIVFLRPEAWLPGSFMAELAAFPWTIREVQDGAVVLVRPENHHGYPTDAVPYCLSLSCVEPWLEEGPHGEAMRVVDTRYFKQ